MNLKRVFRRNGESRQNAIDMQNVSYGIILKFAVVLMRWSTPYIRANGLRLCGFESVELFNRKDEIMSQNGI